MMSGSAWRAAGTVCTEFVWAVLCNSESLILPFLVTECMEINGRITHVFRFRGAGDHILRGQLIKALRLFDMSVVSVTDALPGQVLYLEFSHALIYPASFSLSRRTTP
jgi:hypothetical protein